MFHGVIDVGEVSTLVNLPIVSVSPEGRERDKFETCAISLGVFEAISQYVTSWADVARTFCTPK